MAFIVNYKMFDDDDDFLNAGFVPRGALILDHIIDEGEIVVAVLLYECKDCGRMLQVSHIGDDDENDIPDLQFEANPFLGDYSIRHVRCRNLVEALKPLCAHSALLSMNFKGLYSVTPSNVGGGNGVDAAEYVVDLAFISGNDVDNETRSTLWIEPSSNKEKGYYEFIDREKFFAHLTHLINNEGKKY